MAFSFGSCARGFAVLSMLALLAEPSAADSDGEMDSLTWILVLAAFLAFFAAWGIGANDVANTFATSVGAKSISVRQAVILASIFEFLGAVTMGSQVAKTMRKGIADVECFEDNPGLLMWGMLCVILSVGVWLCLASFLEMPVSTTHSCVGGIIGMTMMARGSECVVWNDENPDFPYVKGVASIVVSWVLSPVASGVCGAIFYGLTYFLVLKHTESSFQRAKYAFPIIVGFTVAVNVVFFVLKGAKGKAEDLGTDDIVAEAKEGNLWPAAVVGLIGFAIAFVISAAITPTLVAKIEAKAAELPESKEVDVAVDATEVELAQGGAPPAAESDAPAGAVNSAIKYVKDELEADPHAVLDKDAVVGSIHNQALRHDMRCEEMFKFVQVFTAIVGAFSHGANDVSNAMGPFSAIYITWKSGVVSSSQEIGDEMYWILTIGGLGIVVGLATYGYKIMSVIGVKLVAVTPSRGYCIELGAAFVVIYGTSQGWPLSTTHCQVGATVGVGLFEGRSGVNGRVLLKCVAGWVLTLIVVGITAAMLVGPNPNPKKDLFCDYADYDYSQFYDENVTAFIASN